MNFDEAIKAHVAWKQKLAGYLRGPDGSIDVAKLGMDNHCPLGQWIYKEAAANAADSFFLELKREHANFHRAAADLVKRANAGGSVSAEAALGANSAYGRCSTRVVQLVLEMKRKSSALIAR